MPDELVLGSLRMTTIGKKFPFRLDKVRECHVWRVHAWVLMGHHSYLLVLTEGANLGTGMKLRLGGFCQGGNGRRLRRGHVFADRYKFNPHGPYPCSNLRL